MIRKHIILILALCGTMNSLISYNDPAQHATQDTIHTASVESFQDFDNYEEDLEQAIEMGLLKRTLEIREPSKAEMLVRKLAASLFMKYLALKTYLNKSSHFLKNLWQKLCLIFIRPSTH